MPVRATPYVSSLDKYIMLLMYAAVVVLQVDPTEKMDRVACCVVARDGKKIFAAVALSCVPGIYTYV